MKNKRNNWGSDCSPIRAGLRFFAKNLGAVLGTAAGIYIVKSFYEHPEYLDKDYVMGRAKNALHKMRTHKN